MTSKVATALLAMFLIGASPSPTPGIEAGELGHKVLSGPDEDGDLQISVKVTVRNTTTTDQVVEVWVQGLDKDEFEVFDVQLKGLVKANQSRTLSDTQFLSEKIYKSVVRWQIEG